MLQVCRTSIATVLIAVLLSGAAIAQEIRVFPNQQALEAEIAGHMAHGRFSALVEAVAPPSLISLGRVRILEQAYADETPPFRQSVVLFRSETSGSVLRQVQAWWDGDVYVYVGLLTHRRDEDLAVLDFILTGDIRQASRWFLTAQTQ